MLLIASTALTGPVFGRSIVYLLEHDGNGTLGVVLNRMSQAAVFNVLPQWADLAASPRALYLGGPVQPSSALCLGVAKHGQSVEEVPSVREIADRVVMVDLDADPEQLSRVLQGVRIFAGYAGWEAGQLDTEIAEGSWHVVQGLPGDIIAPPAVDVWQSVLRRQPWPMSLLTTFPDDVMTN